MGFEIHKIFTCSKTMLLFLVAEKNKSSKATAAQLRQCMYGIVYPSKHQCLAFYGSSYLHKQFFFMD